MTRVYTLFVVITIGVEPEFVNVIGLLPVLVNVVVPEKVILLDNFIFAGAKNESDVNNSLAVAGVSPVTPAAFNWSGLYILSISVNDLLLSFKL